MDIFAEIAVGGIGGDRSLLEEPEPQEHEKRECVLEKAQGISIRVEEGSNTREALYEELAEIRKKMRGYLADYAPEIRSYTERYELKHFRVDGGQEVSLPYYGGPIGYHKSVYETEFELDIHKGKAYYICFDGADYESVVYINGVCVGSHEGFFSPFSFLITDELHTGKNQLKVELYNDYIFNGNTPEGEKVEGDKLYAATGPGWDDAAIGWHHCPAGMGIYNRVYVEERNEIHITDLYVRPLPEEEAAELWVEVNNVTYRSREVKLSYSVFGQNFRKTVCSNLIFSPETYETVGLGDTFTQAERKDFMGKGMPMKAGHGKNIYKIPIKMEKPMLWNPDTPYLYQAQVSVLVGEEVLDTRKSQFGMRSFRQDTEAERKGMFYLNGRKLRLRGANTMGFEQQDIMRGDIKQLIDDILLAKLCNMNFWRFTQRPVQEEVYDYCDRLGLMTQTDLPLFGCMRRTKICEGVRQAEEMECMVRRHPCNILVTYINEPFPNAMNEPHRHLTRKEMKLFFQMCDMAVKLRNPERVIKHVDGDYDPPGEGLPDNHCYTMWYNGHGIEAGRLHRGYWLPVKRGWYYGCGEYGVEGLDFNEVMEECYPEEWLREPFDPGNIVRAQTADFHRFFYDSQETREDWIRESQEYQRFAVRFMTEAFRRDDRMVSSAIHLFIDAWPSGWMKAIMDCRRSPKPAWFAYRDAISPLMLSLRTDRFHCFAGEKIRVECFLCNDTNREDEDCNVVYEVYRHGGLVMSGSMEARVHDCQAGYSSECSFVVNTVQGRETVTLRAILLDGEGDVLCWNSLDIEVFQNVEIPVNDSVILISPQVGIHEIAGERVEVQECGMLPVNFVSRKTGHRSVSGFRKNDFSLWYNRKEDMITAIADRTFTAEGFTPILVSANKNAEGNWVNALVCGEKRYRDKRYVICTVDLRMEEPVAKLFLRKLMWEENEEGESGNQ